MTPTVVDVAADRVRRRVLEYDGIEDVSAAAAERLDVAVLRAVRRAEGKCPTWGTPLETAPKWSGYLDRDDELEAIEAIMRSNRSVCG